MRYGIAHNVHGKNKKSDLTRAPKNPMELMGSPFADQTGEKRPILEEGLSYEGGEGMVAVGEVGVSKRYGGGRDGMHHKMESRTVYKKAPEPTKEKVEVKQEGPKGPQAPEEPKPPVSRSKKLVTANAVTDQYEENVAKGDSVYGADAQQQDAQSFLDSYKQKIDDKYEQDERGNYMNRAEKAQYDEDYKQYEQDYAQYEIDKAEFDSQQGQNTSVSTSKFLDEKKNKLNMKRDF